MNRKRARLFLLLLVVALVTVLALAGEPLYWMLMTERRYQASFRPGLASVFVRQPHRGWVHVRRWGKQAGRPYGPFLMYYPNTGRRYRQGVVLADGTLMATTWWIDGRVAQQSDGPSQRTSSPWLWGRDDETEPSMPPWMGDDAAWARRLEEQGSP